MGKKIIKIRKMERMTCVKEGKWGGSFPHLTNSYDEDQIERKEKMKEKRK